MGAAAQQALLTSCLLSPTAAALPTDELYKRRVLRAVILAAEQDSEEVCEELMQMYSRCLLGSAAGSECASTGGCTADGSSVPPAAAAAAAPPPQPGWCYKLYAYAPADEPVEEIVRQLAAQQQQQQRQQGPQQRQRQAGCTGCAGSSDQPGRQPPSLHRAAAAAATAAQQPTKPRALHRLCAAAPGDARHGLLALHVSLNLLEGGTGCHEWEAGFFLAEWVLSHPHLVSGRSCLEVGCGAGMVGVALHRCGASRLLLTDGNPEAVANCRLNLALNGLPVWAPQPGGGSTGPGPGVCGDSAPGIVQVQDMQRQQQQQEQGQQGQGCSVECRQLCWEDGWAEKSGGHPPPPTVVLGSDLLYDPTVIPVLLDLLKQVLASGAAAQAEPGQAGDPGAAAAPPAQHSGGPPAEPQHQKSWDCSAAQPQPPAVYLATTLRNEATLRQFLAAAGADPALCIEQLWPEGSAPGGGSECAAAVFESPVALPSAPGAQPIRFQHLQELDAARSRIYLHRLTLAVD